VRRRDLLGGLVHEYELAHEVVIKVSVPFRVLRAYAAHYNEARPHRGLDLKMPESRPDSLPRSALDGRVRRHDLLGGLIHEYELVA